MHGNFHLTLTSVKTRMDDPNLEYKPRAQYEHGTETYVF